MGMEQERTFACSCSLAIITAAMSMKDSLCSQDNAEAEVRWGSQATRAIFGLKFLSILELSVQPLREKKIDYPFSAYF